MRNAKGNGRIGFFFGLLLVLAVLNGIKSWQDQQELNVFESAVNTKMEEAFNKLYPDPTISFLGTKSPDYEKAVAVWKEIKVVFMSGEENFLGRVHATPYELSDAAARGRFARFEAVCKIKPQKGCLAYQLAG